MNAEITSLLNQLLTIGIKLLVAIIGLWIAQIGIPWLKQQAIYSKICKYVQAAEKKGESGAIQKADKKAFVIQLLNACGIEVTEEIDAMIESAVEELDKITASAIEQLTGSTAAIGFCTDDPEDASADDDE